MKKAKKLQHFRGSRYLARDSSKVLEDWNEKASISKNFDRLGIALDPNALMANIEKAKEQGQEYQGKQGKLTESKLFDANLLVGLAVIDY